VIALRYALEPAANLIKQYEGLHRRLPSGLIGAYRCPAGVPTIGWGHVCPADQPDITIKDAMILLSEDADKAASTVERAVTAPLTKNQLNALVSFVFNVGSGNFRASTLLRKLNRGDLSGAAEEFPKWKFAGGRVLAGLVARRLAEQALFLS
jgi:GH24 family phage-related lysozyme (muramidase)